MSLFSFGISIAQTARRYPNFVLLALLDSMASGQCGAFANNAALSQWFKMIKPLNVVPTIFQTVTNDHKTHETNTDRLPFPPPLCCRLSCALILLLIFILFLSFLPRQSPESNFSHADGYTRRGPSPLSPH